MATIVAIAEGEGATTLMQKQICDAIKKEIDRAKRILVCAHVNPDPDAVGSTMALGTMLEALGKDVYFFITGFSKDRYTGMPEAEKIQSRLPKKRIDLVFGLDYGRMGRLEIERLLQRDKPTLISIDHHPKQDQRGRVVWVDSKKAAVAEMIYDLAKALKIPLKGNVPFFILFGVVGDTVGLSTQSVTPKLLRAVIDLMKRGASLEKAQAIRRETPSMKLLKLSAKALLRAKFYPKEKLAVAWVTMKDWKNSDVDPSSFTGLANELKSVRGVMVSLFLVEQRKKWYGHLRGRAESPHDLGKIAEVLGGGGHRNAAGFTSTRARAAIIKRVRKLLASA